LFPVRNQLRSFSPIKSTVYRNSESEEAQSLVAGGLDNVRWDSLSDAAKGPTVWAALARKMGPQARSMNLNTMLRDDAFHVEPLPSTAPTGNTLLFPKVANVFDSYAEALVVNGKMDKAAMNYQKAVDIAKSTNDPEVKLFEDNLEKVMGRIEKKWSNLYFATPAFNYVLEL
jgi:hypothetical protein